jgi:hypothetical protein
MTGQWGRVQAAVMVRDASIVTGATTTNNKTGWAAMVGGFINVPGMAGDTFGFQASYAEGAARYLTGNVNTGASGVFNLGKDNNTASGLIADGTIAGGVYTLSTGWSIEAGYEHAWSRTLKTSIIGGYLAMDYGGALCPGTTCDTRVWNVGSRTQWSPVPNFSIGVDVLYTHVDDAPGVGAAYTAAMPKGDVDVWTAMVRVARNFWP